MALAFDASASTIVNPSTSLSFNHTCTGANLILFVGIGMEASTDIITSVTYNSVAMTQVDKRITADIGSIYLYYLINPATGLNAVSVAWDGSSKTCRAMAASYTGARQSSQPDSFVNGRSITDTVTSYSLATSVAASNCWLVGIFGASNDTITAGTGTIVRELPSDYRALCDSNAIVGSGPQNLAINNASSGVHAIVASIAATDSAIVVSSVRRRRRP